MPESPSVARELEEHGAALRRLAKGLVGQDADDLLQETAVRALRSAPTVGGGLLGWLVTVMTRLAANHRRAAVRRARREAPPRDAALADPRRAGDESSHRDSVRAVTQALWSLPEPYQTTLLQRYFQDLSPAQIAARTATPLPTVKSRLQRGLALLRAALARSDGRDWRTALLPALGLSPRSACSGPLLSLVAMSTFVKSAAACAACVLLTLAWISSPPPVEPAAAALRTEAPSDGGKLVSAEAAPSGKREAASQPDAPADDPLAMPFVFELQGRVRDSHGVGLRGAHLALAPPACALALWPQVTDGEGEVLATWRGKVPTMTMAVGVVFNRHRSGLQLVTVRAGERTKIAFVAGAAPLPAQVEVDALGHQVVTMPECTQGHAACTTCHAGLPAPDLFSIRGHMDRDLHPHARFGDRLAEAPEAPAGFVDSVFDLTAEDTTQPTPGPSGPSTEVLGRVLGADGKPAPGVRIDVAGPSLVGHSLTTGIDGTFRFAWPAGGAGALTLRAGGGPEGLATTTVEVADRGSRHVDLHLLTGRTLRGRVLDRDGRPLNGARVEHVADAGEDHDLATTGPDGRFAFANLPTGPANLVVWGVRGEKLPVAVQRALPDNGEVAIHLRTHPAITGAARLFVRTHEGQAPTDVEVRLWQTETGRGASLDRRPDGGFYAHGLAAGFYRFEVGALASGWRDLGTHWVDGSNTTDLGTVVLPNPARLHIDAVDEPEFELWARRPDLDVRADDVVPWTRDVTLPPGRWAVLSKRGRALGVQEFELKAGEVTAVTVAR